MKSLFQLSCYHQTFDCGIRYLTITKASISIQQHPFQSLVHFNLTLLYRVLQLVIQNPTLTKSLRNTTCCLFIMQRGRFGEFRYFGFLFSLIELGVVHILTLGQINICLSPFERLCLLRLCNIYLFLLTLLFHPQLGPIPSGDVFRFALESRQVLSQLEDLFV